MNETIEVLAHLTEPQFRHIGSLMGQDLGRHKAFSTVYVFEPSTTEQATAVCAYLEENRVPYDRETTYSYRPQPAAKARRP